MADQVITAQKLIDADKDATSLDTFINGDDSATVTTRKLRTYPSLAKAVKQVMETGGFEPFSTETLLKTSVPTVSKKAAKALDTKKVWLWDGTQWNDTGLSELDLAKGYVSDNYLRKYSLEHPDYIFTLLSADNYLTDLTIDETGQFADFVVERIKQRVNAKNGLIFSENPNYLLAAVDKNNYMTDLTIGNDGQFADFVVERLGKRLNVKSSNAVEFVYENNRMRQVKPNVEKMAVWGSSTMGGLTSRLKSNFMSLGVTEFYEGAKGGERAEQISARMGARPARLKFTGGKIPASGSVPVSVNWSAVRLTRAFEGVVCGVHGTFSIDYDTLQHYFTRTTAGDEIDVDPNQEFEFIPDAASWADAVCILNVGKNNFSAATDNTAQFVLDRTDEMVNFLKPLYKYVIVMGHFVNTGANMAARQRVFDCNEGLKQRYGDLYFDLQEYVMSDQIWVDTGITPTANDLSQQADGEKPDSLSSDYQHLNAAASKATVDKVTQQILNLNWY